MLTTPRAFVLAWLGASLCASVAVTEATGRALPGTTDDRATCGAWIYPVGDSLNLWRGSAGAPRYRVNRNVRYARKGRSPHDGADLSNRRGGGRVRAAARGIVAAVQADTVDRYGCCVVIAHGMGDTLVYSVYAHLERGSIVVQPGQMVQAGEPLGRVGATGRATHPHLHFEIRRSFNPLAPWQHAMPSDPVRFVRNRLPSPRSDSVWASTYMRWGELAGLLPRGISNDSRLTRRRWSRMMKRLTDGRPQPSTTDKDTSPPATAKAEGTATSSTKGSKGKAAEKPPLGWSDVVSDIDRLRELEDLPYTCPTAVSTHRRRCAARFGEERPSRNLDRLAARKAPPTTAEVMLLLADVLIREPAANNP